MLRIYMTKKIFSVGLTMKYGKDIVYIPLVKMGELLNFDLIMSSAKAAIVGPKLDPCTFRLCGYIIYLEMKIKYCNKQDVIIVS